MQLNSSSLLIDCRGESDIIFVLDVSGSIGRRTFNAVLEYIIAVTDMLEVRQDKTRVGIIKFSDDAQIELHLNDLMVNINNKLQ